jgi:uncharacterized cupin superfamily protein
MANKIFFSILIIFSLFNLYLFEEEHEDEFEYDPKIEIKINSNPSKEIIDKANEWNSWVRGVGEFYFKYRKAQRAYIYEGYGEVYTPSKRWSVKTGDFIEFPKNFVCVWNIQQFMRVRFLWDEDDDNFL